MCCQVFGPLFWTVPSRLSPAYVSFKALRFVSELCSYNDTLMPQRLRVAGQYSTDTGYQQNVYNQHTKQNNNTKHKHTQIKFKKKKKKKKRTTKKKKNTSIPFKK